MKDNMPMAEALHRFVAAFSRQNLAKWDARLDGLAALDVGIIHHSSRTPGITVGEVRRILDIPNSTLSSAVNRLERRGLVRRVINAEDRRSYGLVVTEKGLAVEAAHRALDQRLAELCCQALPDEKQRALFMRTLERVACELKQG
jgi:DNA-binding MarR family transcriptional regulator